MATSLAGGWAPTAAAAAGPPPSGQPPGGSLQRCGGGAVRGARRAVAAAAKRRAPKPPRFDRNTAGGGGRGRVAPKGRDRERAVLQDLSTALRANLPPSKRDGGGAEGGGFGAPGGRRGGGRRARREEEEAEGEADWDEELLADLSDSGEPCLTASLMVPGACWLGEADWDEQLLAGLSDSGALSVRVRHRRWLQVGSKLVSARRRQRRVSLSVCLAGLPHRA